MYHLSHSKSSTSPTLQSSFHYLYDIDEATFNGETKFNVMKAYLEAPCLRRLKFSNVLLKEADTQRQRFVLTLRELYIYGSPFLAPDDYFLLYWLTRNVSTLRLKSFIFTGDIRFNSRKNSSMIFQKDPQILKYFLRKHGAFLKHVTLSGVDLQIQKALPQALTVSTPVNLYKLKSLSIALDIRELKILLCNLESLEVVRWDKYQYHREGTEEKFPFLLSCLENNYRTLTILELTPVILSDNINNDLLDSYIFDCQCLKHCHVLKLLRLRMNFFADVDQWQYTVPGKVRNINALPNNLDFIEIWTDYFHPVDLQLFENRFDTFVGLRTLYLTCPTTHHFTIPTSWVSQLQSSSVEEAVFLGGRLENLEDARRVTRGYDYRLCVTRADVNNTFFKRETETSD